MSRFRERTGLVPHYIATLELTEKQNETFMKDREAFGKTFRPFQEKFRTIDLRSTSKKVVFTFKDEEQKKAIMGTKFPFCGEEAEFLVIEEKEKRGFGSTYRKEWVVWEKYYISIPYLPVEITVDELKEELNKMSRTTVKTFEVGYSKGLWNGRINTMIALREGMDRPGQISVKGIDLKAEILSQQELDKKVHQRKERGKGEASPKRDPSKPWGRGVETKGNDEMEREEDEKEEAEPQTSPATYGEVLPAGQEEEMRKTTEKVVHPPTDGGESERAVEKTGHESLSSMEVERDREDDATQGTPSQKSMEGKDKKRRQEENG